MQRWQTGIFTFKKASPIRLAVRSGFGLGEEEVSHLREYAYPGKVYEVGTSAKAIGLQAQTFQARG